MWSCNNRIAGCFEGCTRQSIEDRHLEYLTRLFIGSVYIHILLCTRSLFSKPNRFLGTSQTPLARQISNLILTPNWNHQVQSSIGIGTIANHRRRRLDRESTELDIVSGASDTTTHISNIRTRQKRSRSSIQQATHNR